jgi:hypothetical protein
VVLLRCLLVPEIKHGGTPEVFMPPQHLHAVAYSDSPVCVCLYVCYIDYIVNLKNLLVKNHLFNFIQTWQD